MSTFETLGLTPTILQAVRDAGYITPTPIQSKVIPSILMGQNILAIAQTGTGKTASFVLPLIDILSSGNPKPRMPRALILAPTRELALQIQENLSIYSKYHALTWTTLIGGESMVNQEKSLEKNSDIIIATPGRFLDLKQRGKFLLNNVKVVVIDEADRMLDMGFLPDINTILAALPVSRQTLLFSATLPDAIKQLTKNYLADHKEIIITPESSTATTITQHFFKVSIDHKPLVLKDILQENTVTTIIFCNRKKDIEILKKFLTTEAFKVDVLHGDMTQAARSQALDNLKDQKISILIASDVAARGIDINHLGLVINYDLPLQSEDYVHRIGRTGRAGNLGQAISLVTIKDKPLVKDLEKLFNHSIDIIEKAPLSVAVPPQTRAQKSKKITAQKDENPLEKKKSTKETPTKAHQKPRKKLKTSTDQSLEEPAGEPIVGFGDHFPAFLNKSVRSTVSKSSL